MIKFFSILVSLLFTFSITAIAFAVDKPVESPQMIEKGSQTMGVKKAESPATMKKEVKGKETQKAHKAKKTQKTKKTQQPKKPIKKASKKPAPKATE